MHEIIRYIASYSYKKYYTEISLYEPVRNLTVDGLLINDMRFIQLINVYIPSILNLLKNKRFILFDYTVIFNDNGNLIKSRIAERIIKYMRNVSKEALFVIGTRWNYSKSTCKLPAIIKHKKKNISINNTYLISPEVFATLLQIKGKFLNIYRNALQCSY